MKLKQKLYLVSYLIILLSSTTACANDDKAQQVAVVDNPSHTVKVVVEQTRDPITTEDVQRFGTALEIIKRYYVEEVPNQKLFDNALRGLLSGLDPHSSYLDEAELKDLKDATSGQFSGLGVEVTPDSGYLKVITPIDDSPAQKAGMKAGDYIVKINDELVKDMTLGEAIKKMRGPKGSSVNLTIVRSDAAQPLKLKIVREMIKLESVKGKMLEPGYGYIRISNFQEDTATGLEKTIAKLKKEAGGNLKGLALDVRNNPGGLLEPAVQVADDFLNPKQTSDSALIVSAKGRYPGADFKIKAKPDDLVPDVPMVVLINQGSASGAEIVAGALQDYKRAVLVGTQSFGKGSVQTVIPLDDKSAIKLTTALYYTPNGRSIQASGIQPDVLVENIQIPSKKDQTPNERIFVKEADLKGHLANGNGSNKATVLNAAVLAEVAPEEKELVSEDYQLFVALNVLKGLVAVQPTKK